MSQAFIAYLDADKPDRFILRLAEHFKDTLVRSVTAETIRQAAKKIYPDASPATWNRQVIKPTQAAINHCAALGWCTKISVKRYPEDPKKKTPASLEWVEAFAAQAKEDDLHHLAALALFMFGTGARIGEACQMTWADVDLQARTAIIRMGKPTPWSRTAHLPPPVVAALASIPSNRNPDDTVFGYAGRGSVKDPWGNVCARAGIEHLTPHCCRHGFATSMLRAGYDVKTVAERGGWKDAATVLRTYAHAITDISVTDAIFDTPATQSADVTHLTAGKERRKRA